MARFHSNRNTDMPTATCYSLRDRPMTLHYQGHLIDMRGQSRWALPFVMNYAELSRTHG